MANAEDTKATRIIAGPFRLFYANVLKPKANDQGKMKYSACLLWPKSDAATTKAVHAALAAAKRAYEIRHNGGAAISKEGWDTLHTPVRDGDKEFEAATKKDADYKGHWFMNASSDNAPGIVDKDLNRIIDPAQVYSGMFARVDVNFYPFNNKKKGVAVGLNHIQKVRDGQPKTGAGAPEAAFDRYEDNSDEDEVSF